MDNSLDSLDNNVNHLDSITKEIKSHRDKIEADMNYIAVNWYKFWKWDDLKSCIDDVNVQVDEMDAVTDDLRITSQKITQDVDVLNATNNTLNNSVDDDSVYAGNDSYAQAKALVQNLKALNIDAEISEPTNFKEGDIVQYYDEGKYYRYLEYRRIDNATNYVKLQDRNRNIFVSQAHFNGTATFKISSPNNSKLFIPINNVLEKQLKNLNRTYNNELSSLLKLNDTMGDISTVLVHIIGWGLLGVLVVLLISAAAGKIELFLGYVTLLAVAVTSCGSAGIVISILKDNAEKSVQQLDTEKTNLCECIYGDPHSFPVAENYNLTTQMNKELYGVLSCSDFDSSLDTFNFTKVKGPEHGSLNLTNTGDFGYYVYTPDADFSGVDSFTYKVNDGLFDSNIAQVYINVSKNTTHIILENETTDTGDYTSLKATLLDEGNHAVANKTVQFMVNGRQLGTATTNENGTAIIKTYIMSLIGKLNIQTIFMGDTLYSANNTTSIIKVLKLG